MVHAFPTDLLERFGLSLLLGASILGAVASFALGRKRVHFNLADYSCLILPFLSWSAGFLAQDHKSLANPFVEATILAALVSLALAGRLAIGARFNERTLAIAFLVGLVTIGFLLGRCLHALPE